MLNKKFIQVNIVDNEYGSMDSYIIIVPDDEMTFYEEKLNTLKDMVNNRFNEKNEFYDNYGAIYDYLSENFEILNISQIKEIEW